MGSRSIKPISRRSFLSSTAAGLGGIAWGTAFTSAALRAAPSYAPFKMGFQSYSLRHFQQLDDFLREAGKLQLGYVELWRGHLNPSTPHEEVARIQRRLAAAGLTANAFGVENFTADHEKNEVLFKFGQALGVQNLSANPSKDAFSSLEKLVKQYDIRIAIHNHGPEDEKWRHPDWILQAVKDLDPRIGACADLGHFIRAGVNPVEAIETLGSRVLGVHLKDFDRQGKDTVLGQGQLDVEKSLAALIKVGFNGPLSLEFEGDKENPVPKMEECLAVVRQAIGKIKA